MASVAEPAGRLKASRPRDRGPSSAAIDRRSGGRRPRVIIDYTPALTQGGGIGRYARGLVGALLQRDPRPDLDLRLAVAREASLERLPQLPDGVEVRRLPLSSVWLTRLQQRLRLPLPSDWLAGGGDLYHSMDFVLPPLARARGLVTVHDLSFLTHPQGALPSLARFLTQAVPRSLERAGLVLADSESTRRDLERWMGLSADRVAVVGAGVEPRFRPIEDRSVLDAVRNQLALPERFVLGLGTLEPRKNFPGLIQAFEVLAGDRPDLHLVIAGGHGWLYQPILRAAEGSPLAERIHLAGFVADEDLPALYNLAELFAFPSYYEGFGIPVLEAMACGRPVVSADNSSLPEVAGDAALLVPAGDRAALVSAMQRLLDDPALSQRMIARGLEQAAGFSWQAAADRLLEAYSRLLGQPI